MDNSKSFATCTFTFSNGVLYLWPTVQTDVANGLGIDESKSMGPTTEAMSSRYNVNVTLTQAAEYD